MKTDSMLRTSSLVACASWRWCDGHARQPAGLHQHEVEQAWREHPGGPELSIALEAHDEDGDPPRLAVNFSQDGEIVDGCVSMPFAQAESYAHAILAAIAQARAAA
jgi:hypothetical protein